MVIEYLLGHFLLGHHRGHLVDQPQIDRREQQRDGQQHLIAANGMKGLHLLLRNIIEGKDTR